MSCDYPFLSGRGRSTADDTTADTLWHHCVWVGSAALPADRDESHQAGLRQRVAPAMAGAVLHDAIALAQMHLLPVVQFERHLAANHDAVVDRIRRVHTGRATLEMIAHAGEFVRQLLDAGVEGD